MRERYGREAFSIGFSTYTGTVTAASDWDAPAEPLERTSHWEPGEVPETFPTGQ